MVKNKSKVFKDILLYILPVGILFMLVFVVKMFAVWAFLISAGIFTGLLFLFNPVTKTRSQAAKELVDAQTSNEIDEIKLITGRLHQMSNTVQGLKDKQEIALKINKISDLSDSIIARFSTNKDTTLSSVTITKSYLQLIENIILEYLDILAGKTVFKSSEEKVRLISSVEEKTLPEFQQALENMAASLDTCYISCLKVAIDTLSQLLKDRGLVE